MTPRRTWGLVAATLALTACTDAEPVDRSEAQSQDIVDIDHTVVKDQSIGNCWVYASVGWAESLRLTYTGETLNLSESWISYWHWYEQIIGGENPQPPIVTMAGGKLNTGGWWGTAGEIMLRYGVIDEGSFIADEAEAARSQRQHDALAAIEASLASGVLSDPANRSDRALVRQELDAAWGLTPEVRQMMDAVFGADVAHTLYETRALPEGSGLRYPADIPVGTDATDGTTVITLADAIGQPSSWSNVTSRVGPYAWSDDWYPYFPQDRRAQIRRMQEALHEGLPVVMSWFVDFNAMGDDGAFRAPPTEPGHQGGHMVTLEDYAIDDVPGYGSLEAGTLVTDEAALTAALDDQANLRFVRVKNSWGTELAPPDGKAEFAGYHDIYRDYLDGTLTQCTGSGSDPCTSTATTNGLWTFVLPPASFSTEPATAPVCSEHDSCTEGSALDPTCGSCVADICAADPYCCSTAWDNLCVDQVQSVCGDTTCAPPPPPAPVCAHDTCVSGAALDATCDDPCVASICAADPYCCNTAWDNLCVDQVTSVCGGTCP